jgi:uncharacterized protein YecA (UPF0149 family)
VEKDDSIRTYLAHALLANFAFEGIEPVRQLARRGQYDRRSSDLPADLATAATIMEVDFPEREKWQREGDKRRAETERHLREMEPLWDQSLAESEDDSEWPENWGQQGSADHWQERPSPSKLVRQAPLVREEKRVGRNDPCPCGSGKKFKKCCMNRQQS